MAWCVAVYLVLAGAGGLVWENAHDEGITFWQAIGDAGLSHEASGPDRVADLYRRIDGSAAYPAHDVIGALTDASTRGMHPPAYYLFLNQWARWVGTGTLALRLPAYLAGILSLVAMSLLSRRLIPRASAAVFAPALLAVSPWFVSFSSYARPYAFALCIALWSTHFVLEIVSTRTGVGRRVAFVLLSLLGLYTLYHYAFVLAWQATILGLSALRLEAGRRGRELGALAVMGSIIVVGFLPWVPHLLAHLRVVEAPDLYFKGALPPGQWLSEAGSTLLVFGLAEGASKGGWLVFACIGLGVCTLPLALSCFSPRALAPLPPPVRLVWYLMPLMPALILAADVVSDSKTILFTKTGFPLFPLLVLLVVGGFSRVPLRALRIGGLAAWSLLLSIGSADNLRDRARQMTDFERVAHEIAAADDPSHVVAVSSIMPGYLTPLLLTFRDAGIRDVGILHAPPSRVRFKIRRLLEDPAVRRVTLVNFKMPYAQDSQTWSSDHLERLAQRAHTAGWEVRPTDRRDARPSEVSERRTLSIAPAVRTKFFSM